MTQSSESDEQQRAAEAESYGGAPISDAELGEVWTASDVVSDPAKDDSTGGDWSDEGGATPAGPATNVDHDSDASHDPAPESDSGSGTETSSGTEAAGSNAPEPPD